ncbi:MAG TPA: hypothetical protein VNB06_20265 [Thermoanaerobaculia bacterium]|nr:hypothetical protein [Thermoanaerobaculia bacterium]
MRESVARWAALRPAEPALCYREGWDWRWWTWAELEAAVAEAGAARSGSGRPAVSVPVGAAEVLALVELASRDRPEAALAGSKDPPSSSLGPVVPSLPAVGRWRRWLRTPSREVVVEAGQPDSSRRIAWLRWAVAQGAALVMAPSSEAWLDTTIFARPTVSWGGVAEAASLLDRARGRRRVVDRLRAFGWTGEGPLPEDMAQRFRDLHVTVVQGAPAPTGRREPAG